MKLNFNLFAVIIFSFIATNLYAETLFEVKDAQDSTVFSISNDGMRVFNNGDTLMVISSTQIKAFIDNSKDRALSRSFSISTNTTGKGLGDVVNIAADGMRVYNESDKLMEITGNNITAYIDSLSDKALSRSFSVSTNTTGKEGEGFDIFDVTTETTSMREGTAGNRYTDFSEDNIFLGENAGIATTPGQPNPNDSGMDNIFLGNDAGISNTSGYRNFFGGFKAGYSNLSGEANIFIGNESGRGNIDGRYNIGIGVYAGYYNNSGGENVFIGTSAGFNNLDAEHNVCIGNSAGMLSYGSYNTYVGAGSGENGSSGTRNSFYGYKSGEDNDGSDNCIFGSYETLHEGNDGSFNTIMGNNAGKGKQSSSYDYNCIFGYNAGYELFSGSGNLMMGKEAGYSASDGSNNVYLGNSAGRSNISGSNNVFIGNQSGFNETGSNRLYIDNSSTTTPLVYGEFDNNIVRINGDLNVTGLTSCDSTINVNDNPIYLKSSSTYTGLRYREYWGATYVDGPTLFGNEGGALGTANGAIALTWSNYDGWVTIPTGTLKVPSIYSNTGTGGRYVKVDSYGRLYSAVFKEGEDYPGSEEIILLKEENEKLNKRINEIEELLKKLKNKN